MPDPWSGARRESVHAGGVEIASFRHDLSHLAKPPLGAGTASRRRKRPSAGGTGGHRDPQIQLRGVAEGGSSTAGAGRRGGRVSRSVVHGTILGGGVGQGRSNHGNFAEVVGSGESAPEAGPIRFHDMGTVPAGKGFVNVSVAKYSSGASMAAHGEGTGIDSQGGGQSP